MGSPGAILSTTAARAPSRPALVFGDTVLTYYELDGRARRVAGALRGHGIAPGDRVSIYAQNRWEWIVAYHGILRAGAVVNPINVMLTPEEVAFVLNDCGATAIIASQDKASILLELTSDVPSLRHVFSFDEPPPGVLAFDDLTASDASPPDVSRIPRRSARSATPRAPPGTPRERCSPTRRCS
jgi:long-chain acyl-CoA synthetase